MPYSSNDEMPSSITDHVPSAGQSIMRNVINQALDDGKSERVAFASAWAALSRAGYTRNDDGDYVKKAKTFNAPESARNNAKKVLRWKEEHGDEVKGMTQVGWARARQLANNENLSLDTVKRMASFARHEKNSTVAEEYKDEPWKDAGYVAWLGWGGSSGINWAKKISQANKRYISDDQFSMPDEARARSHDLDLGGFIHVHSNNGQSVYMPGRSHDEYMERMEEIGGIEPDDENEEESSGLIGLLTQLRDMLKFKSKTDPEPDADDFKVRYDILKSDDEERMVYGWGSVISKNGEPVVDLQGDVITAEELVKFSTEYMLKLNRVGKEMHEGEQVSVTVHSFPMVKEIADAFGLSCDQEGWMVAQKVYDDDVWARVKSGDLSMFSIGGKAIRRAMEQQDDMG